MMQENTEDNMFNALLSDYAAPIGDDGFSEGVLASLPTTQISNPSKAKFVSIAAVVGGGIAALQLPSLWRYISNLKLPSLDIPNLDMGQVEAVTTGSSYTLVATATFAVMMIWLCSTFLLGDQM